MKNTLRKLYDHHSAVGKDLQRRIAKLREDGKDPSLPQLPPISRAISRDGDSRHDRLASSLPLRNRNLDSSTNTVDESFMVLNQQSELGEESPFDLFWKVTGEIMVNLSQPTSFQTAALAALDEVENRAAINRAGQREYDLNEPSGSASVMNRNKSQSNPSRSRVVTPGDTFELDDEDYESSDSFCLVPSNSDGASGSSKLRKENAALKAKLDAMEKQMSSVRRQMTLRTEQDQQLRDNIMLARKEAQRAMAASMAFGIPSGQSMLNLGLNAPAGTPGRDRESQLLLRVRGLEEELRTVRLENDKQKAMIAKFRERWERLKESAKRKKSAKSAGKSDTSSVRERIDEDPEAEEAEEELSKNGN